MRHKTRAKFMKTNSTVKTSQDNYGNSM